MVEAGVMDHDLVHIDTECDHIGLQRARNREQARSFVRSLQKLLFATG